MMKQSKSIFVNQKGMVTLPLTMRRKHNITPGTEIAFVELEGVITLVPIRDIKATRNISKSEMEKQIDDATDEELRLEQ